MAKKKTPEIDAVLILQIVVAVFLITIGISGIVNYNKDIAKIGRDLNRFFGGSNNPVNLIVAILELAAGIIVAAALVVPVKGKLPFAATLGVAVLWIVQIIISVAATEVFKPDAATWLNSLAGDLILLVCLWLINRKYA